MKISVIFSTYNSIDWLIKVLWGFHYQTDKNFEVIIASEALIHHAARRFPDSECKAIVSFAGF